MRIQGIIFDIGGVLLDDPSFRTFWQGKEASAKLRYLFGTGQLSKEDFIDQGSTLLYLDKETFLKDYSVAYSGMQPDQVMIELFKQIKIARYIFSDTNPIHFEFCNKLYPEIFNADVKLFLSFEMKMRKDNDESYKYVLANIPFKPEELVFIDNKSEYIEQAKKFGINGIVYTKGMDIKNELLKIDTSILY